MSTRQFPGNFQSIPTLPTMLNRFWSFPNAADFKTWFLKRGLMYLYGRVWRLLLSRGTSGPEFCVIWPRKMPALGWRSLWESSSFVPWFSTFVFRNVPGTVPECVRICEFKRNPSNPKCGTLSGWTPGTVFQWLCLQSLQKLVWYIPR